MGQPKLMCLTQDSHEADIASDHSLIEEVVPGSTDSQAVFFARGRVQAKQLKWI